MCKEFKVLLFHSMWYIDQMGFYGCWKKRLSACCSFPPLHPEAEGNINHAFHHMIFFWMRRKKGMSDWSKGSRFFKLLQCKTLYFGIEGHSVKLKLMKHSRYNNVNRHNRCTYARYLILSVSAQASHPIHAIMSCSLFVWIMLCHFMSGSVFNPAHLQAMYVTENTNLFFFCLFIQFRNLGFQSPSTNCSGVYTL